MQSLLDYEVRELRAYTQAPKGLSGANHEYVVNGRGKMGALQE